MKKHFDAPSITVDYWTGEINAILSSVSTAFSGWLAPIPEAAMTAQAIQKIFELNPLVSVLVAASIELVGLSVNEHFLAVQQYNADEEAEKERRGRKTHLHGLENESGAKGAVIAFYIVTGAIVSFTAFYEVLVERAALIKLLAVLFPVASAIGTLTMNKRAAFHRKVQRIAKTAETFKSEPAKVSEIAIAEIEDTPLLRDEEIAISGNDILPTAKINQWREIAMKLNGERESLTIDKMKALLEERGFSAPSERTLYNWLKN